MGTVVRLSASEDNHDYSIKMTVSLIGSDVTLGTLSRECGSASRFQADHLGAKSRLDLKVPMSYAQEIETSSSRLFVLSETITTNFRGKLHGNALT